LSAFTSFNLLNLLPMDSPLLATIFMFGSNFAPQGYLFCSGQLLAISSNTAVFSLLGTTYGGNGTTNFALPDLRGRVPNGQGQGPGLQNYNLGQASGIENQTLLANQVAPHSHPLSVYNAAGNTATPGNTTFLAAGPATGSGPNASQLMSYTTAGANTSLNAGTIGINSGGSPFSILQPYLTVSFIIAMVGTFPTRN